MFTQKLVKLVLQELCVCFGKTSLWDAVFFQWLYLIALSSVPLILEFTQNTESHDWVGLLASWTGIVCVILVAEGRASNYLFWSY